MFVSWTRQIDQLQKDRSMAHTISSNSFHHDDQVVDALEFLETEHPSAYVAICNEFTEQVVTGRWFDDDLPDYDAELGGWLCDAIEESGHVIWFNGEPYALGADDDYTELFSW